MPDHVSYPDADDLLGYLRSLAIFTERQLATALPYLDLAEKAAAASAEWERETGWHPFVKDREDVTRYYDPGGPNQYRGGTRGGGRVLHLDAGLLTVTSVHSGFSSSDDGTPLAQHADYRLRPYNAATMGQPYTEIEMIGPSWGLGRSIRIIGRFGYRETVPDDVWTALLQYGAALMAPEFRLRRTRGLIQWKQAETSEQYAEKYLVEEQAFWESRFRKIALRYKRVLL